MDILKISPCSDVFVYMDEFGHHIIQGYNNNNNINSITIIICCSCSFVGFCCYYFFYIILLFLLTSNFNYSIIMNYIYLY
uniref:Uncharacterized protein n=1 Tax=Cannabis sativa TaxID=3483 RepID=A0A803QXN2_CANSA